MPKLKKVKKIAENLLVEHSLDFIVESSEMVTLTEGESGAGGKQAEFLKLTGVFQKGNVPNGNRRIYKTELLVREDKGFQSKIRQGTALGKGYHPGFFDIGGPSGLSDVTHRILKTWMEGDIVRGELIILKTSMGKEEVEPIIAGGGKIGISSRGYGSMEYHEKYEIAGKAYKDVYVIDDNYQLMTYDLVLTPSVKSAMLKKVKKGKGEGLNVEDVDDDNVDENNVNEDNNSEGGKSSMTKQELKSLHPELYVQVHTESVEEGRTAGATEAKAQAASEHKTVVEAKDVEIGKLTKTNESLTTENADLKKTNEELKAVNEKVEAEKLAADIKIAVTGAVGKSDFKDYFKAEDIEFITSKCASVEDAVKEVDSRDKVYESAIATFKAAKVIDTKSKKPDTSEGSSGGTTEEDKDKTESTVKSDMRAQSGL